MGTRTGRFAGACRKDQAPFGYHQGREPERVREVGKNPGDPETTTEELKALLAQAQEVKEEEQFLSDPTISFERKRQRLRAEYPDVSDEQIESRIESYLKDQPDH